MVALYGPRTTVFIALDDGVYEFTYGCNGVEGWTCSREKVQPPPISADLAKRLLPPPSRRRPPKVCPPKASPPPGEKPSPHLARICMHIHIYICIHICICIHIDISRGRFKSRPTRRSSRPPT